jgi:arylsulfatase
MTRAIKLKQKLCQYSCAALFAACGSAMAQVSTGTPGSPSATTTIDGKYLPNPPPKFGGEIGLDAAKSKPYWPPTVAANAVGPSRRLDLTRRAEISADRPPRR